MRITWSSTVLPICCAGLSSRPPLLAGSLRLRGASSSKTRGCAQQHDNAHLYGRRLTHDRVLVRSWHTAASNPSDQPRVAVVARYAPWWLTAEMGWGDGAQEWVPRPIYDQMGPALQKLVRHRTCSIVSRHDIAAIWVAFFSRWQRYRC